MNFVVHPMMFCLSLGLSTRCALGFKANITNSFSPSSKMLATSWTLGLNQRREPYHIDVIKSHLTRNLGNLFSDLREEIMLAFGDIIPPTESTFLIIIIFHNVIVFELSQFGDIDSPCRPADWTKVKAYGAVMNVVGRASNRIFVGAPLCMFVC
jgi:hypothetical protein